MCVLVARCRLPLVFVVCVVHLTIAARRASRRCFVVYWPHVGGVCLRVCNTWTLNTCMWVSEWVCESVTSRSQRTTSYISYHTTIGTCVRVYILMQCVTFRYVSFYTQQIAHETTWVVWRSHCDDTAKWYGSRSSSTSSIHVHVQDSSIQQWMYATRSKEKQLQTMKSRRTNKKSIEQHRVQRSSFFLPCCLRSHSSGRFLIDDICCCDDTFHHNKKERNMNSVREFAKFKGKLQSLVMQKCSSFVHFIPLLRIDGIKLMNQFPSDFEWILSLFLSTFLNWNKSCYILTVVECPLWQCHTHNVM